MLVTPFVGVWIETSEDKTCDEIAGSHTLRGCVDWNTYKLDDTSNLEVTPFVGVWIETDKIDDILP